MLFRSLKLTANKTQQKRELVSKKIDINKCWTTLQRLKRDRQSLIRDPEGEERMKRETGESMFEGMDGG